MLNLKHAIVAFFVYPVVCFGQESKIFEKTDSIIFITDTTYSYDSIIIEEYIEENIYKDENYDYKNQIGFIYSGNIQNFQLNSNFRQNDFQLTQPAYVRQSSVGIEYGRKFTGKLNITMGLFFTQTNQKYFFKGNSLQKFTYYEKTDTLDISYWDNPQTPGFDSIIYVASEINNYENIDSFPITNPYINNYKYVTLSIGATYNLYTAKKLFLQVLTSGNFSFLKETTDMNLYQKNENYISALNMDQFRKVIFTSYIGVGAEYNIYNKISVSINGLISKQFGSIFKKDAELISTSIGYNIKIGLINYF